MKVNRLELRNILAALRPGLAKREFVAQLTHFMFLPEEIVTYNDKVCLIHPYETTENPFSIKGEEFFRIIDGMTDDEITIIVEETKIKIRSKSTSATMKILGEDLNKLPESIAELKKGQKGWKELPEDFLEGISLCSFSTSPDLSKGIMACVWIIGDTCYSLDHARSSRFKMSSEMPDTLYLIGKECAELVKFPVTEYCTDEKWAHFRTEDGVVFSCMPMKGSYPLEKVNAAYDTALHSSMVQLPKELKSIVDSVVVLAGLLENNVGRWIELTLQDDELFVKATSELGEVEKTIPCKYDADPISLRLNVKFLSQILDKATSLSKNEAMVHFKSGPFQHIMAQTSRPSTTETK